MTTTSFQIDLGDVDALAAALKLGGIKSATRDRDALRVPGILIQLAGIRPATYDALEVSLQLLLVANDVDDRRTWEELADLHNKTVVVLDGLGVQYGQFVGDLITLPGAPSNQLPALSVPVQMLTTHEETP